ncbi:AgmX/PglI C-terminal domain-containing protein, partial [Myxococcota bacterium]|nr:AgmX/PglI C-terminal domain-containing protein [Myxococcota bacterium]
RPAGGGNEDAPSVAAPRPAAAPTPPPEAPKPPPKKGGDEVDDLLGAIDGKKPAGGGGTGRPAPPPPGGGDDPLLPEQLTKPQILGVVKKGAGAISSCKDRQPDASGTVFVTIKIGRNGKVDSASAKKPFDGTPVGNCVESTVKTFTFPQFSGDPMTINMPFAL